ncbi:ATP-dependent DNA ligase [Paracidobacterium acidisoli]|uniref:DNA ligase n=1 Tax=Paracidobacterium acidisoli TaxID=2303751 RepID=A0A372IQN5_9BACT|nr:ATP-dependent DNA ligase [Paracidobacterium acidisoli]MBT9331151.1 ATP-dependent DNA ligase [Paracidobacterium acidisoli]
MSLFLPFAELCDALAATTKKLEKRALIAQYLKSLPIADASRAVLWLSGSPFAETDRRALNAGGSLLSKAVAQLTGADRNSMHAAYRRHGDFGAASADLLAARLAHAATLTLAALETAFDHLAAARGSAPKLRLVTDLLAQATPVEAKYLIKLILGDMRTGVQQSLVEEAIAAAFDTEVPAVRRAGMLLGNLGKVVAMAAQGTLAEARMKLFHPLGFMLASPVATVDEAIDRFARETEAEETGFLRASSESAATVANEVSSEAPKARLPGRPVQMEDKYDGIRAQLHCGDSSEPGRVGLFSRSREDLSDGFPDLIEAFAAIPEPVILDGEILAWNAAAQRALPFSSLQQRIGRKRVTEQMREQIPVVFMAFDLLYGNSELQLEQPLRQRRTLLENFLATHGPVTAEAVQRGQASLFAPETAQPFFPRLMLAPATPLASAEQLDRAYSEARNRGNEGVMLKSLASTYQPGRRGLAWLKLKRELATLDVVVTGAEFGNGRRAAVLSDYTFAVRDGATANGSESNNLNLKNVGKAYSGLTDAEIAELTDFFKAHTLEDFGTFRTVEPLIVLEVAFNNVMRSDRHASGFALRFPRIVRIRTDKPVEEIDTLQRVEEIYAGQPELGASSLPS